MNISDQQREKADAFKHLQPETFVMPCAWDTLSAMIFQQLGFKCMGTTSGGVNWNLGKLDYCYSVSMQEMMKHYGVVTTATCLPVSGDLENGYGDTPDAVVLTIEESIVNGLIGGSIEDQSTAGASAEGNGKLLDIELAVERISAAREKIDSIGLNYTLTARCELYCLKQSTLDKDSAYSMVVDRLNRYRAAGADCLFAPGINDPETLGQLVKDVDGPISFGMGATEQPLTVVELEDIGVRRISTGGGISRAAYSAIHSAGAEIMQSGTFTYLDNAISDPAISSCIKKHIESSKLLAGAHPETGRSEVDSRA